MRILRRPLNWALIGVCALGVAAILLGQESPYARAALCAQLPCPHLAHSHAWEKIAYDLGIGSIISLFFYFLVVRIPEDAKRRRVRRSFARHFREFKEESIATMLMAADGTFPWGFQRELVDQKRFRAYFQQKVAADRDKWDDVYNKMTEYYLNELLTQLEILRGEILFTMGAVDIEDKRVLEFLKRLSATIVGMRKTKLGDGSMKIFDNFLWEVFAGFNMTTGYEERDFFEDMIQAI